MISTILLKCHSYFYYSTIFLKLQSIYHSHQIKDSGEKNKKHFIPSLSEMCLLVYVHLTKKAPPASCCHANAAPRYSSQGAPGMQASEQASCASLTEPGRRVKMYPPCVQNK